MTHTENRFPLVDETTTIYSDYPFISMIKFSDFEVLGIINNYTKYNVSAYVLDFCDAEDVEVSQILKIGQNWYNSDQTSPISLEFSKYPGIGASNIFKTYNINFVSRIVGPAPKYNNSIISSKRFKIIR